jgi:hypothetical protein
MRTELATRNWIFFAVLLGFAVSVQALSIGRARAVPLIGKPLDVAIPIALDESEDASQLCPEAEVFFGDDRLSSNNVSTSLSRGSGREQILRVRTNIVVNEPVVAVLVRAGCGQKSQRRFTFLADVETEAASISAPNRSPVPIAPGATNDTAPATGSAAQTSAPAASTLPPSIVRREQRPSVVRPIREAAVATARPRSVIRKEPAPSAPTAPKAERLKVDTFDPLTELIPNLRGSNQMLSQPNEAARAEAAALWRAINAQPGDVLRDTQRLQTLETNVKTLQTRAQTTEASVQDVRGQLDQARKERYLNPVVYGLGALLLLSLLGLGYMASRLRRSSAAPSSNDWRQVQEQLSDRTSSKTSVRAASIVHPGGKAATINTHDLDDPGGDMIGMPEHEEFLVDPVQPTPSGFGGREMSARSVDAEELFDVQQQADFFMSLGQYDQAIEVLQNHISDNVETSALAYLDLLDIYVRLGRRDDYDSLRADFNQVFNGQVPSFDDYRIDGRGLDAYQGALSRIEQLWGRPQVLEVIEESLFRKPDHESQAFDLQAYRELLLLYSVAKENALQPDSNPLDLDLPLDLPAQTPAAASMTMVQPLSTDRSMQTTPLSERDVAAFERYAQAAGQSGDDELLDIDLDVLDSQMPDLQAEPKAGQPGGGSAWIEFDLDELQPAQRKPKGTE